MKEKNLFIIAGCNGAGKTTASFSILPEILQCKEFVNADEIAKGLSPFQPENVAIEAGKIMLERINELFYQNISFAFETTLSSKIYKNKILEALKNGYSITLIFFWLNSIELAKQRVKTRVKEGGHNIPEATIERRYINGLKNLFNIYLPIIERVLIFDNSYGNSELIAKKTTGELQIINQEKFEILKKCYEKF
ncbi:MAG: zeta toxin family protein [Bacteroidetes bacterium]|nr:zeta toxin family protein [Bacteroidota bacterium]